MPGTTSDDADTTLVESLTYGSFTGDRASSKCNDAACDHGYMAFGWTIPTNPLRVVDVKLVVRVELPVSSTSSSFCRATTDFRNHSIRSWNAFLLSSGPVYSCASISGEKAGGQFKITRWNTWHPRTANSLSCRMTTEIQKGTMLLDVISHS